MTRLLQFLSYVCLLVMVCAPAYAVAALPVKAESHLRVFNYSDSCAWITAYWSYTSESHWRISAARWVPPEGQTDFYETFNHPTLGPQWRVRAEVRSKDHGACRGSGGDPDVQGQLYVHMPTELLPFTVVVCHNSASLTGPRSTSGYKVWAASFANVCRKR